MIALLRVAVSPVIKAMKMIIFWLCFSFLFEFYFNNFEISQSGLYSVSEEEYYATITWGKTNKLSKSAKMVKLSSLSRQSIAQITKFWCLYGTIYRIDSILLSLYRKEIIWRRWWTILSLQAIYNFLTIEFKLSVLNSIIYPRFNSQTDFVFKIFKNWTSLQGTF